MTLIPVKYTLASKSGEDTVCLNQLMSVRVLICDFKIVEKLQEKNNIQTLTEQVGAGAVKALPLT